MTFRLDQIGAKYFATSFVVLLLSFAVGQVEWLGSLVGFPTKVLLSIITSCILPGISIALLLTRKTTNIHALDIFLAALAANLSITMVMNLVCFFLGVSAASVIYGVFLMHLGMSAYLYFWFGKKSNQINWLSTLNIYIQPAQLFAWSCAAIAMIFVVSEMYIYGSQAFNTEELIYIRKIVENEQVLFDNLSYRYGDTLPYLVAPFYFLVAEVSIFSSIDPIYTYALFWAYSAFVGIICLASFIGISLNSSKAALYTIFIIAISARFMPMSLITMALGIPAPNRYGLSAGILLPLGMALFVRTSRGEKLHAFSIFSVSYVILELTFVHAREAAYLLAFSLCYFIVSLSIDGMKANSTRNALKITVYCAIMLVLFMVVHGQITLGFQNYLSFMKESLLLQFHDVWKVMQPFPFGNMGPSKILVDTGNSSTSFYMQAHSYKDIYIDVWSNNNSTMRMLLPASILIAPIMAVLVKDKNIKVIIFTLSLFALFMLSPPLRLIAAYFAGTSELLTTFAFQYILALALAVRALMELEKFTVGTLGQAKFDRLFNDPARYHPGRGQLLRVRLNKILFSNYFVLTCFVTLLMIIAIVLSLDLWQTSLLSIWSYNFALIWHFLSLIILSATIFKPRYFQNLANKVSCKLIAPNQQELCKNTAALAVCALVFTLAVPMLPKDKDILFSNPITSFSGNLLNDYDDLKKTPKFSSDLPVSLIKFLRTLDSGKTIFSESTYSILLSTAHYAPIVSVKSLALRPSFILNWKFIDCFGRSTTKGVLDLLNDRSLYNKLIECVGKVDYFVTKLEDAPLPSPWFRASFKTIWTQDGYTVLVKEKD